MVAYLQSLISTNSPTYFLSLSLSSQVDTFNHLIRVSTLITTHTHTITIN